MRAPKPKQFDPVPAGNHVARLYQIIHIGTISNPFQGQERQVDTLRLVFELCNERKVFKEDGGEQPYSIGANYTFSMGNKANLRKIVQGILGKVLSDDEAFDIEIEKLLGKACLLSVVHKETSTGKTIALIQSASPLPKGLEAPDMSNLPKFIDVNESDRDELDTLPDFLRDKVQSSEEYGVRFLGKGMSEEKSLEDSVPF